jgi:hypothetical protein
LRHRCGALPCAGKLALRGLALKKAYPLQRLAGDSMKGISGNQASIRLSLCSWNNNEINVLVEVGNIFLLVQLLPE